MKTQTVKHGGTVNSFPVIDGKVKIEPSVLAKLSDAVKLILYFYAVCRHFHLEKSTFSGIVKSIGKLVDRTVGGLTTAGMKSWGNDPEVLDAAERHRAFLIKDPGTVAQSVDERPENPELASRKLGDSDKVKDTPPSAPMEPASDESRVDAIVSMTGTASEVSKVASGKPDLAELLTMIQHFLLRFVVFAEPAQVVAVTLWIAHTWLIDAFRITPYLHIYSPTKRCGKSRLLECLHALVCRPWSVVSATEATIMRKIDAESPTLLYDEIDAVYRSSRDKSKEGLRAVLNCGFVRGSKVPRCAGREIVEYSVFCPKAFAGIGDRLPDTIKDRSIRIQLIRRAKDQPIETFRFRDVEESTKKIVEGLASWAGDDVVIQNLQTSRPVVPQELGDRAADIAEPLLAIAGLAGWEWADAAQVALVAILRMNDDEEADEPGVRILAAIREIFVAAGKRQLSTLQILRKLALRDEEEAWTMQWPRELAGGNTRGPAAKMSTLLRPYGISAGTIRLPDGSTPKGYRIEAFGDAFDRYLPSHPKKLATTPHGNTDQGVVQPAMKPTDTEETDNNKT